MAKKTPEQVIGKYLSDAEGMEYQDGDFHYDARVLLRRLSRNGFRVVERKSKRGGR